MINLVQEGAGHQVLTAFVEIVFDNTDNRIPVSFFCLLSSLVQTVYLFIYFILIKNKFYVYTHAHTYTYSYVWNGCIILHIFCEKQTLLFMLVSYFYLSAAN